MITLHRFHPNQYAYFQRLFVETAEKHPEWLKTLDDNYILERRLPNGKTWLLKQINQTLSATNRMMNRFILPKPLADELEEISFQRKPLYEFEVKDNHHFLHKTVSHNLKNDIFMKGYTLDYIEAHPAFFQHGSLGGTVQTPEVHETTRLQVYQNTPACGHQVIRNETLTYQRDGNTLGKLKERTLSIERTTPLPNNEFRAVEKTYVTKLHPETGKKVLTYRGKTTWIQDSEGNLDYNMD
jgi:hypothetical protein